MPAPQLPASAMVLRTQPTFTFPNGIAAGPNQDRLYVNDFINRFPPTVKLPPIPRFTVRQVKLASLGDLARAALAANGVDAMVQAYRE